MLPRANVVHLFFYKFTRLRGWRLALARVLAGSFESTFFRHNSMHDCNPSATGQKNATSVNRPIVYE